MSPQSGLDVTAGEGFEVRVTPAGSVSWIHRYRQGDRQRRTLPCSPREAISPPTVDEVDGNDAEEVAAELALDLFVEWVSSFARGASGHR